MDIGCYCTDLGRLITGEHPDAITCSAHLHESGIDDYAAGTLVYPSGVINSFICGMTLQANNMALVLGEDGYVEVDVPWKPAVEGALHRVKGQKPPKQGGGGARREQKEFSLNAPKPLYALEADDFTATVLDGAPPAISAADSLSNMRVLDELRRQAGLPF